MKSGWSFAVTAAEAPLREGRDDVLGLRRVEVSIGWIASKLQ